jgi:hypothetical protein
MMVGGTAADTDGWSISGEYNKDPNNFSSLFRGLNRKSIFIGSRWVIG